MAEVWYVDAAGGDDANDGRSSARSLASVAELVSRILVTEACSSCKRTNYDEGHRAGCEECSVRSVLGT